MDKPGGPTRNTKPKRDFGFAGRIVTLAFSLIALGFSWYTYKAINRAPLSDRVREVEVVETDEERHKIIREEYQLYQSDLSSLLAVAGIVFALFTFGFPILQHQFITKEHVDKMGEGLKELSIGLKRLDLADAQIKQAVKAADEAKTAQETSKADLEAQLLKTKSELIEQNNQLVEQYSQIAGRTDAINQVIDQINQLRQQTLSIQSETAQRVELAKIELASMIQATGRTQPKKLPKIGELYPDSLGRAEWRWRVLDVDITNNRALLLSEYTLEEPKPYNNKLENITWEKCTLRDYLNGEFYESFSEDKKRIHQIRNENPDNTWGTWSGKRFKTPGGKPTDDHIFLLSVPEVLKYFPGLKLYKDKDGDEWRYEADKRLVAKFNNGAGSWWWLRSPGYFQGNAAFVHRDGRVNLHGNNVYYEAGGVRPALWLNL